MYQYQLCFLRPMKQEVVKRQNLKGQRDVLHICNNLDCPLPPLSLTPTRESPSGFEKTVSIPLTIMIFGTRSVSKKLVGASKLKGCEGIKDWIKGVRRHIYSCATSTKAGFQSLIVAKWKSFIRHVSNKHSNHPDELYKQCNHGVLEPRKWIKVGKNGCFNPESCCWGRMQEAMC